MQQANQKYEKQKRLLSKVHLKSNTVLTNFHFSFFALVLLPLSFALFTSRIIKAVLTLPTSADATIQSPTTPYWNLLKYFFVKSTFKPSNKKEQSGKSPIAPIFQFGKIVRHYKVLSKIRLKIRYCLWQISVIRLNRFWVSNKYKGRQSPRWKRRPPLEKHLTFWKNPS